MSKPIRLSRGFRRSSFLFAFAFVATCGAAELREFTDTEGRSIKARLMKVEDGNARIKREDGRSFTLPKERFSPRDRKYIKEWARKKAAEIPPKLRVEVTRLRRDKENEYNDPDDRKLIFRPEVIIANQDRERSFENLEVTLIMVGESVFTSRQLKLIYNEKFTTGLSLDEQVKLTGKEIEMHYDDNPGNGHAHGYKYGGYAVLIRSQYGHLYYTAASISAWEGEEFAERAEELKSDVCYDRKLEKVIPERDYYDFY